MSNAERPRHGDGFSLTAADRTHLETIATDSFDGCERVSALARVALAVDAGDDPDQDDLFVLGILFGSEAEQPSPRDS